MGEASAAFFVALAVTVSLEPAVIRALRRWDVVDRPGARSSHTVATPRGGGLAVLAGIAAAVAVAVAAAPIDRPVVTTLVVALAFGAVGALEDFRGVPPLSRFALQSAAATVTVVVWLYADPVAGTLGRLAFGAAAAFLLVAFANAFNFMDGINGISAAQVIVATAAYAGIAATLDDRAVVVASLLVCGCALGFLPWNFPRAAVFLGDAGSYAFGAALMLLALSVLRAGAPVEAAAAPLLVYVGDTSTTLVRRVRRGEAWHLPHRTHVYQRLTDCGFSHVQVTTLVAAAIACCAALGAVTLTASPPARAAADAGLLVVVLAYLVSPTLVRRLRGAA